MQRKEINQLKKEIENILNDNKAIEIKSINLKDKTSIADFMIVASGNSSRHIQALSEILLEKLKKEIALKLVFWEELSIHLIKDIYTFPKLH